MPADRRRRTKSCCLVCRSPAADSHTSTARISRREWSQMNDEFTEELIHKSKWFIYSCHLNPNRLTRCLTAVMMWQMIVPSDNKPAVRLEPDQRSDWPGNTCLLQPWFLKTPERCPYSPTASDAPAHTNDIHMSTSDSPSHNIVHIDDIFEIFNVQDLCDLLRLSEFLLPGDRHLLNEFLRLLKFFLELWSFKRLTNTTRP